MVMVKLLVEKGSVFQGNVYPADTIPDATQALRSLAQNDDIAKSEHWKYIPLSVWSSCEPDIKLLSNQVKVLLANCQGLRDKAKR